MAGGTAAERLGWAAPSGLRAATRVGGETEAKTEGEHEREDTGEGAGSGSDSEAAGEAEETSDRWGWGEEAETTDWIVTGRARGPGSVGWPINAL